MLWGLWYWSSCWAWPAASSPRQHQYFRPNKLPAFKMAATKKVTRQISCRRVTVACFSPDGDTGPFEYQTITGEDMAWRSAEGFLQLPGTDMIPRGCWRRSSMRNYQTMSPWHRGSLLMGSLEIKRKETCPTQEGNTWSEEILIR